MIVIIDNDFGNARKLAMMIVVTTLLKKVKVGLISKWTLETCNNNNDLSIDNNNEKNQNLKI